MKNKIIKKTIKVQDNIIRIMNVNEINYISLTDLARCVNGNDPSGVIRNWMSSKNSFSFYALWEELNNPNFNSVESHRIKIKEVPYNRFTMTPSRWKKENPNLKGNLRDYANVLYLMVLGNLEAINSEMLLKGITKEERLIKLNDIARRQIDILKRNKSIGLLDKVKNDDKLLINNKSFLHIFYF